MAGVDKFNPHNTDEAFMFLNDPKLETDLVFLICCFI
jgi:hypothetical protein